MAGIGADPITIDELPGLFGDLAQYDAIFLAVSGGIDSTALLHLIAEWRRQITGQPEICVLTVDHGLRPEASREAAKVAAAAARLGLSAKILTWAGPIPQTGVQEAARDIRYDLLLGEAVLASGRVAVVTAHHRDDLAETLLMRLARGAGVDGLAAMQPRSMRQGIAILRPLLGIAKSRLRATLVDRGASWIDDPSNLNPEFERVSLRARADLRNALSLTDEALALTANRMARARTALERMTHDMLRQRVLNDPLLSHCGLFHWRWPRSMADEWAIRFLMRLIPAIGGASAPLRMRRVERLHRDMQREEFQGATLGNCAIKPVSGGGDGEFHIHREPNREPLPELTTDLSEPLIWDNRFEIRHLRAMPPDAALPRYRVRAIGPDDLKVPRYAGLRGALPCPRGALEATPVVENGCGDVWISALDMHEPVGRPAWAANLSCRFRLETLANG